MVQAPRFISGVNRKSKIQNSQESGPVPGDGTQCGDAGNSLRDATRRRAMRGFKVEYATRASSIQNP